MRSIRSPKQAAAGRGRYKLLYNHNPHLDVYSQQPRGEGEESQYMADSFCVGDNTGTILIFYCQALKIICLNLKSVRTYQQEAEEIIRVLTSRMAR